MDNYNKLIAIAHPDYIEEGNQSNGWRWRFYKNGLFEQFFINLERIVDGFWLGYDPANGYFEVEKRSNGVLEKGIYTGKKEKEFAIFQDTFDEKESEKTAKFEAERTKVSGKI